jgi:hypothetical protein
MADFLTRLASRVIGLGPRTEPVVTPMFAPEPTPAAATGSGEILKDLRHLIEPATGPDASRLPSASLPETAGWPGTQRSPEPAQAASAQPPGLSQANPRVAPAAPDETVASVPAAERPRQGVAGETTAEDALLLPLSGPSARVPPVGTSARAEAMRPPQPRGVAPASWEETGDAPLLMPLVQADAPPLPPAQAEAAPPSRRNPPTPASLLTQRQRGGEAAATLSVEGEQPPVIRVSIGRVEVRAIHAPAPAAKPPRHTAPKLSLDDYLKQRDRGTR